MTTELYTSLPQKGLFCKYFKTYTYCKAWLQLYEEVLALIYSYIYRKKRTPRTIWQCHRSQSCCVTLILSSHAVCRRRSLMADWVYKASQATSLCCSPPVSYQKGSVGLFKPWPRSFLSLDQVDIIVTTMTNTHRSQPSSYFNPNHQLSFTLTKSLCLSD